MSALDTESVGDLLGEVEMENIAQVKVYLKDAKDGSTAITMEVLVGLEDGFRDFMSLEIKGGWGIFSYGDFRVRFRLIESLVQLLEKVNRPA